MAQIFSKTADTWFRLYLALVGFVIVALLALPWAYVRSDYATEEAVQQHQPVPFSHRHHAGQLGIDCRYCHDSVEYAAVAGFPPTHTCMTCHSQVWTQAEELAPIRASLATGTPLAWNRVHDLPDFVYFRHDIHLQQGVGCEECHGEVPEMARTYRAKSLTMSFCLDCHREPWKYLRPPDQVLNFDWQPPPDRERLGRRLVATQGIEPDKLDNCYHCHR